MTIYYQCKLRNGSAETVGWVEERGAKVGVDVELAEDGSFWRVLEVWRPGLDEAALRSKQKNDRNALPSLVGKR